MEELAVRLAPTVVAALAATVAWIEYRRKRAEDIRSQRVRAQTKWWDITRWAIEKTNSDRISDIETGWLFLPVAIDKLLEFEDDDEFATTASSYLERAPQFPLLSAVLSETETEVNDDDRA